MLTVAPNPVMLERCSAIDALQSRAGRQRPPQVQCEPSSLYSESLESEGIVPWCHRYDFWYVFIGTDLTFSNFLNFIFTWD